MRTREPNQFLIDFETQVELGPTFAARLLGLPYITYAQYRNNSRSLKMHHEYHIQVLLLLDRKTLMKRIKEVAYGDQR